MSKTIYHYDEQGRLRGQSVADESPLEPGVYLIPAMATNTAPPDTKENQACIFTGGNWKVVADYVGVTYWMADGSEHKITDVGIEPPSDALFEKPIIPEPPVDALRGAIASRRAAYVTESDPLYMEWRYDETDETQAYWMDKVRDIKLRYPLPHAPETLPAEKES